MRITNRYIYYLLSGLCLMILAGCGDSTPPAQQTTKTAQPAAAVPTDSQSAPAPTPKKNLWPPENDGSIPPAKNLLAKNYYLILDASGSMNETECSEGKAKIIAAKRAVFNFANLLPDNANLGLMVFVADRIQEWVPLGPVNPKSVATALNKLPGGSGTTPLRSAISEARKKMEIQAIKQLGYGTYNLVVITDGDASKGQNPDTVVNDILAVTPIQIHTIGFCIGSNHALNIPGKTVYKEANNPAELERGLSDVLAEAETFDVSGFEK